MCAFPLTTETVFLRVKYEKGGEKEVCDLLLALRGASIVLVVEAPTTRDAARTPAPMKPRDVGPFRSAGKEPKVSVRPRPFNQVEGFHCVGVAKRSTPRPSVSVA
jgi:hypothetical protein